MHFGKLTTEAEEWGDSDGSADGKYVFFFPVFSLSLQFQTATAFPFSFNFCQYI